MNPKAIPLGIEIESIKITIVMYAGIDSSYLEKSTLRMFINILHPAKIKAAPVIGETVPGALTFFNSLANGKNMKKLIGEVKYQWFQSAFIEYNKLRIMAVEAGAWYIDHPSKAINKQRNKLIKFLNSNAK